MGFALRCSELVALSICYSKSSSDGTLVCELPFLSRNAVFFCTAEITWALLCDILHFPEKKDENDTWGCMP